MIPVFFQYKFNLSSFLDKLIEEFACETRAWEFNQIPQGYVHKYLWPDIVLSDRDAVMDSFDDMGCNQNEHDFPFMLELLGCYAPKNNNNDPDGEVILFMPKIIKAAEAFVVDYQSYDLKKCIEDLTLIVLIHEFTHWIVHTGVFKIGSEKARYLHHEYSDKDTIYFHESIAQIITNYFCSKEDDLWKLYCWLEHKQPEQYHAYKCVLLGTGIKQVELVSGKLYDPIDKEFHLRIDDQFSQEHNVIDRVVFTLMLMRLSEGKDNSYTVFEDIYHKLKSDSGAFQDKFIVKSLSICLEVFKEKEWDLSLDSFDTYITKYRGSNAAKGYNV